MAASSKKLEGMRRPGLVGAVQSFAEVLAYALIKITQQIVL
jgi:hypothetical protein